MNTQSKASDMMAAIRASYRQKLVDRLLRIENSSVQLDRDPANNDAIAVIRRECHKLSGVSTSIGFPEIGEIATEIDCAITLEHKPWSDLRERVEELLDVMEGELD